ncbi:GNAT family N-acetyltransferase [Arboricoccus pini]|uniref:GNAT family N-acetyltransferase n=1 Tax=Arboricoccus pini TaxID=1963835 RepID=UPI0013FD7DC4|nr:GNAT family N-acetyltransferase [Arboricoccus pini]
MSAPNAEPTLHWSTAEDDAACGRLIGITLRAAPYRRALARAMPFIANDAPMHIPSQHQRIIACAGQQIIGAAQFAPEAGYLDYLFVTPAHQGQRLGARLLREVEHHAKQPLRLVVLSINKPARRFYERAGYVIERREREDDWYGQRVVWITMAYRTRPASSLNIPIRREADPPPTHPA